MTISVAAFYKFVRIDDALSLRDRLFANLHENGARGTILLATEGINGTLSAEPEAMARFLGQLRADPRFADLVTKDASAPEHPFKRLKVKLKREIISFRQQSADPTVQAGTYVKPQDWNALIADPSVLVLDTRNAYEVAAGTFRGAIDPQTRRFGDLPAYIAAHLDPARHTKVAMFCTGGIRCEKASAFMLSQGLPEVFHLEGGILNYLAHVPREESQFNGACFVFDERETV
jgi:UPF0176 protein